MPEASETAKKSPVCTSCGQPYRAIPEKIAVKAFNGKEPPMDLLAVCPECRRKIVAKKLVKISNLA